MDMAKMFRCQSDLYCTKEFPQPNIEASADKAYERCKNDLSGVCFRVFLFVFVFAPHIASDRISEQ